MTSETGSGPNKWTSATLTGERTARPAPASTEGRPSSTRSPPQRPDELYAISRLWPDASLDGAEPGSFSLRYRVTGDALVVASSGWGRDGQIPTGQLFVVGRHTRELPLLPVGDLVPS